MTTWTCSYLADGGSITSKLSFTKESVARIAYQDLCDMVDANSPAFPKPMARLDRDGKNFAWYVA